MAGTDVNRTINAPFEKVWEVATDLKRWEEWNTLFTKWKSDVPDSLSQDAQMTAVLTIMGMANAITLNVDEYNPPKLVTMSGTGMAGAKVSLTLSVDADGDTTSMAARADFVSQMMVGAIGKAIERAAKKELDASLDKLAAIVE
ncbi:SRPBCC family protein [Candidatus Mycobacterium wuenschmannii]|uniref:SRPBCC family protein n=1 Tax=Candidatus Mycobacterium wuenschmannii TaxID=3027808 RepID=A0ABY8VT25_9MYCO|nr:SRPBCC family protein [Candidatus Mycobacterium wuenschmannii]WIM86778.1 SRPBCC family protein [Candidatus Mycobacterium wuenschmannii]